MNKLGGFKIQVHQEGNTYLPHTYWVQITRILTAIIMNKSKKSSVSGNTPRKGYSHQIIQSTKATLTITSHLRRMPVFVSIVITSVCLSLQRQPFNFGKFQKSALRNRTLRQIPTLSLKKGTCINFS